MEEEMGKGVGVSSRRVRDFFSNSRL